MSLSSIGNTDLSELLKCVNDILFSDMENGDIGDMQLLGIAESYRVKRQVLISGSEAAEMILRVDNILRAAPRQRDADHRPC